MRADEPRAAAASLMDCDQCELEHTPELAKSLITTAEACEQFYGYEINSSGKITSLKNPNERTPSLHVYEDAGGWWDFSTGEGGDVIDFVMAVEECTFSQAVYRLVHKALKAGREPGDVEKQPVKAIVDFRPRLQEDETYTVNPRNWPGLSPPPNVAEDYDGHLLIPHEDQDGVYGVKVRGRDGSKSAWPGSIFTKRLYDPMGWSDDPGSIRATGACVIAEGESDCWALSNAFLGTIKVLALPSGAGCWKDHFLTDLEPFEKIWVCTDNDRAGEAARQKITSRVGHLRAEQLRVPPLYGDAREAIAAGWRPSLP